MKKYLNMRCLFTGILLSVISPLMANTYTVNTATDFPVSGGVVTVTGAIIGGAGAGQVSLRSAIIASNANAGADIILFNAALNGVPITLSIVNAGGVNEDACQTGDLDVTGNLTITGNGAANTIIQAGTTNANGIDKVFAINPFCNVAIAFTITGVTIRYGRNSQPFGAPDFSYTGGGIDWCGIGNSTLTMTNCVIDNNNNLNGYGGGLNIDEVAPAAGVVNITGTTFSNNNCYYWGGGVNIFGDDVQVTVNNSTISGNTTTGIGGAGTQGGGANIRITHSTANPIPFVTFDNTSITGNTGKGFGGGVCIQGSGKQNVTFQNGSSITNNTVLLNGVICQGGGIEIDADPAFTNTFNGTIITGNHADAGANARGGGVFLNTGVMNMTGGSISNNTSREGAGFALEDGTVTMNRVTATNNSATVSGGGFFTTTTSTGSLTMNFGRIVNNTAPAGSALTRNTGTISVDNNWWGINTTPAPSLIAGAVTVNNWLQLKSTASASPICSGANSIVTASFLTNSVGTPVTLANLVTLIGQSITFSSILGTLSSAQPTIQPSGTATVTYTAGGTGGAGSVNAQVDNVPAAEITPSRASITVNTASAAPTGATGTTTICSGGSTTLTVTGGTKGTGASTQWFTGSCGGLLVFTGDALNTGALVASTTYFVRYTGTCNTTTCATVTVTVVNGYTWFGSNSTSWTDASNWSACGVPPPGADITIATTTNSPTLPAGTTVVGMLTMNAGININLGGNTLSITSISGLGAITGSSTSNLIVAGTAGTINFTQTSAATRSLNNLTLSTGSSATLGNALDVYGTISLTTGSLNLNAQAVTLKSNATNTARVANLTGSTLSGATNVTVERWIKLRAGGTGRAYRLLAPTVNTTGTVRANWMEGGMNTVVGGANSNPVLLFGTHITGAGGNANGFDVTQNNQASVYATTNAVTPTYAAIGNTSGTLNALTGYFLFVRGDRSMNIHLNAAPNMPTSSTTLRTTGTLITGTQTAFTNAFIGGAGAKNLITNPYASPIDWAAVNAASTNVTGSYTYWDANIGLRGGFATVTTAGVSTPATSATQNIQSGQAFFVEASGAPVPTVSIQESHKSAGNNNGVFRTPEAPMESFRTELYFTEANGYRRVADGVIAVYDNKYKAAVDADDATEIGNWDENIAISRDGKKLAIEARPVITKTDDLPIYMNNMKKQDYEFEFTPSVFTNTNLKAELVDKFLGTRTLLSVTSSTTVGFTITDDPASAVADRFTVVFGAFGSPSGVDAITIKAFQQNGGVQVDWTSKTETDMVKYEVEKSAYGTSFSKVNSTTALGNSTTPVNYNWFDTNPVMGNNFYRIKGIDKVGNVRYSDMVKVLFGKGEPGIVVYPNPLQGKVFQVDMNNLAKGTYLLNLYNTMGQKLYSEKIQHDGAQAATKTIDLNMDVEQGFYQLQLIGDNGYKTTKSIIKN
jgi:hypothetical protein